LEKLKRLTHEEATFLKLDLKKNEAGRKTAKYKLSQDQTKQIKEYKESFKIETETTTKTNQYKKKFVLSAWNQSTGQMMDINTYCLHYSLPRNDIASYKLVSHTGTPYYNIAFNEKEAKNDFNLDHIRGILNDQIKKTYKYQYKKTVKNIDGVLKWSDLHFGAHIRNLIKSPDYDSNVLLKGLMESVEDANELGFKKTHVHINGDLIESFTGLSHINSWMSLDKNQIGANSIMLCCNLLEQALNKIENLGSVKIVAGNHDRLTSNNKEDVKGGAAELIAWGLTLKGFDVEFNPMVITHLVNGINHINLHGHLGLSKQSTEYIILNYGIQGTYNLICEAHLHSIIEKLSIKQRSVFKMVSDDSIDYRRMHLQSFFTGNFYSESLGFTTNAGYSIFWDNGKGKPKHLNATR
jgi:hypothetical protein